MLKLKYNEELKTKFLAFWALDTVAQFNSLTEDPVKYINNFFKLSPDCREIITAIIRKNIKNHGLCIKDRFLKINDPEKLYVKKNTLNAANHDIELLDTYSLITIKKNRSNLDAAADIVCLSKTLLEILKKIPVINTDELLKKNYPVKKKLPRPEKSLLHRIYNSLYFKEHKEPALVHSLAAKKLIKPVITPDYQPALITHHTLKQEPVPLEPAAAYNFRETPAYLMHLLDERLYRLRTNSRKKSGSPAGTVEPDITFIQELAAGIVSARKTSFFSKLPFYKKYYYILKFFFPDALSLYTMLAHSKIKTKLYSEAQYFFRYLTALQYSAKNKHSVQTNLEQTTELLVKLGLLVKNEKNYFFDKKLCKAVIKPDSNKKQPKKKKQSRQIIIDSDMHITAYRDQLTPQLFYFFLTCGKTNCTDYMVRFSFTAARMSGAVFSGFTPDKVAALLEYYASESFNELHKDHLFSYFNQAPVFTGKKAFIIKTYCNEAFQKSIYLLKKNNIPFQKITDRKNTLLFLHKKDMQNARNILDREKLYIT